MLNRRILLATAAGALAAPHIAAHRGRFLRVDTARTDGPFVAMLKACGLPAHDTVTSMWLGRPRPVDPEMQIFGLANQAIG